MKNKVGLILVLIVISELFIFQALAVYENFLPIQAPNIRNILPLTQYIVGITVLIFPVIILRLEIDNLEEFGVDKFSLIALAITLFVNLKYYRKDTFLFISLLATIIFFGSFFFL